MKKYILASALIFSALCISLVSCGGTDASNNNGSDTGVNGTNNGVTDSRSRGMTDSSNGISGGMTSGDGMVENDVYNNDGFANRSTNEGGVVDDILNGDNMGMNSNGTSNTVN